jgi:cell wall-associated NlpC family hydrolase
MTEATQEQSAASAAILAVPTRPADGRGVGTEVPTQPDSTPATETGDTLALDAAPSTESPVTLTVAPETNAATEAKPAPSRQKLYVVRKGDSLARIARREGVSVSALAKANGLKARSRIRAGVRLRIPSAGMKANRELASAADAVDGSNLGDSALRYRGVPYRYAGMSSRGMDCSGLVARVLQAHGIRAPHNARALFQLGKSVSRGDLKADDLVFFSTRGGGISHVGIYLGGGKFVHASSGGGRVQVDSLDSGYYAKRLVGARRLG